MVTAEHTAPSPFDGLRQLSVRLGVAGPIVVVGLVLGVLITLWLKTYHGNPLGLVLFGHNYVPLTHPPSGAPLTVTTGYDGQFYWLQATDPLVLHHATIAGFLGASRGFQLQRMAYPALAYLLAAGQRGALAWTLLAVNVIAVLGITAGVAVFAQRRGWSCWWALAIGLMPGLLMPTLRDLSDGLATAAMLGGLLAVCGGRRWWAASLFTLAVLSREPTTVVVVAVAVMAAVDGWRARHQRGGFRRVLRQAWPVVVVPAAAFLAWQTYIHWRAGALAGGANPVLPPFKDFVVEVRFMATREPTLVAAWDLVFLALILAGMGTAVMLVCRRASVAGVMALLVAGTLTVIVFGDQWGDTRYSAPLFGALLLAGLEQRSRTAVAICVAAAAMSSFLVVGI